MQITSVCLERSTAEIRADLPGSTYREGSITIRHLSTAASVPGVLLLAGRRRRNRLPGHRLTEDSLAPLSVLLSGDLRQSTHIRFCLLTADCDSFVQLPTYPQSTVSGQNFLKVHINSCGGNVARIANREAISPPTTSKSPSRTQT